MNNRLEFITFFRGIAALFVCLDHGFLSIVSKSLETNGAIIARFLGAFSVNIFFIISGFVILLSLEKYNFKTFLINRIFRLYPLIVIVIPISILVRHSLGFYNQDISFKIFYQSILMYDLFNFLSDIPEQIIWTISVELKFYIFIAIIFYYFSRKQDKNLELILVLSIFFNLGANLLISHINTNKNPIIHGIAFFTSTLPIFLCGSFFYFFYQKIIGLKKLLIYLLISFFSVTFCAHRWFFDTLNATAICSAILIFMLIFYIRHIRKNDIQNPKIIYLFLKRMGVFFGDISYPLYLSHPTVLIICLYIKNNIINSSYICYTLYALLIMLYAFILHKFIEKPAINFGKYIYRAKS